MFKKISLFFLLMLPMMASAISVNKMLLVADKNGRGIITVDNPDEQTAYIKLRVFEVKMINGEAKKVEYTDENFADWKVRLGIYKTILEPQRTKDITFETICGSHCNYDSDIAFFIYVEPYIPVELRNESGVVINYGYAPLVVVPAKESNYQFEVDNNGNKLTLSNTGNRVINFDINHCKSDLKAPGCSFSALVLPGRVRTFPLDGDFQNQGLAVTAFGIDGIYKQEGHYKVIK
ncbi:hypothetical protein [Shewanella algae]|uniref:hypothetical protein n=1 Tax=Shewanella algae TaxID=38313 RepID=UPI000C34FD36|nr:hypothetical protein [Shewanella algae]MBO2639064.1 hypothetical protein [Shewanella algae]MBO2643255.1 hypothetical protein [Shewanella algae]